MRLYRSSYKDRNGKSRKSSVWWVRFVIDGRRVYRSTELHDRRAAEERARDIVTAEERRSAGIETHDEARTVPVGSLVSDYIAEMRRRGRSERHVTQTQDRISKILDGCALLTQATTERIRRALGALQTSNVAGPRTANGYRVAVNGFFAWLVREGRWPNNPVAAVGRAAEVEATRTRRALMPDEIARLVAAAPQERATCYLLAVTTGLRRSELGSLTWGDVDLDAATVTLRARSAKNRREAVQPLPPATVAALAALRRHAPDSERIFRRPPSTRYLMRDLAAAGIEYTTDAGTADVHALRVSYATALARAGVPLTLAQRLMRHSDPRLTSNVYTRLELHDATAAVAKIDVGCLPPCLPPGTVTSSHDAARRCTTDEAPGALVESTQLVALPAQSAGAPGVGKMEAPRGIEPRYTDLQSERTPTQVEESSAVAKPTPSVCLPHRPRNPGSGEPASPIDLSAALAALASAGLPPDALALAVEALLRTARASAPSTPATPPRLLGGA